MVVPDEVIERFLTTGRLPRSWPDWDGPPAVRRREAEAAARDVLARIVRWRARRAPLAIGDGPADPAPVVVARARPMVEGLFPPEEAAAVLACLPRCVRVVTPARFAELVADLSPRTGWDLANLLLDAMGAPPLADDSPALEGISHAAAGYVLPAAFTPGDTSDVLVHELAHVLHSVPRARAGLSPGGAPLLVVAPARRETFAWACEVWSRLQLAPDPARAVAGYCESSAAADPRVDRILLQHVLTRAAEGDGWASVRTLVA